MKLHLGYGYDPLPGFLNIDIVEPLVANCMYYDLTKGLPETIADESVDFCMNTHFLEHIYPWERDVLLRDIFKKLKSGGQLRTVLPDFKKLATAYVNNDWSLFQILPLHEMAPLGTLLEMASTGVYQYCLKGLFNEHKAIYDADYFCKLLKTFGFSAKEVPYDNSIDPDRLDRSLFSFVVLAEKPL